MPHRVAAWGRSALLLAVLLSTLTSCAGGHNQSRTSRYPSGAKEEEGLVYVEGQSGLGTRVGLWTAWYENGQKKWEGEFVQSDSGGLRTGRWTYWYPNGTIAATGFYSQDLFDGEWVFNSKSGKEIARCVFSSGSGWYIERDEGGNKLMEGEYQRNMRNGKWTTWYPNGRKRAEGLCRAGARDGEWSFWSEDGKLTRREVFDHLRTSDFGEQAARVAE